jgi:hypothetical protein
MEYTHVDISIPLCGRASLHAPIQKVSGVVQNAIQDFGLHDVGVGISICQVPLHVAVLVVYDLVSVFDQSICRPRCQMCKHTSALGSVENKVRVLNWVKRE